MNIHTQAEAAGIKGSGSRQKNDELYRRLVSGDDDARRQMIEGNMALAVSKVDQYVRTFPAAEFLREDMISEGLVALTVAVNKMQERGQVENPNPTSYICFAIQNAIGELVDDELNLQAPTRTQRLARAKGEPIAVPAQVTIEPDHLDEEMDPMSMSDLRDLIDSCCESDEERVIVALREKGYVDREIAQTLGLPHSTTYMLRRGIYERFLAKTGMVGEV